MSGFFDKIFLGGGGQGGHGGNNGGGGGGGGSGAGSSAPGGNGGQGNSQKVYFVQFRNVGDTSENEHYREAIDVSWQQGHFM